MWPANNEAFLVTLESGWNEQFIDEGWSMSPFISLFCCSKVEKNSRYSPGGDMMSSISADKETLIFIIIIVLQSKYMKRIFKQDSTLLS